MRAKYKFRNGDKFDIRYDDEQWMTTENGHHILVESETGEIMAGFGGKFTGEKVFDIYGEKVFRQSSNLGKSIGIHFANVQARINKAEIHTQQVLHSYLNCVKVGSTTDKGACFSVEDKSIKFDLKSDAKGIDYGCPYSTMFHESGHAIDSFLGEALYGKEKYYSVEWKNGALHEAIKTDVKNYIEQIHQDLKANWNNQDYWDELEENAICSKNDLIQYGDNPNKYKKEFTYKFLSMQLRNLDDKEAHGISDSFGGATQNRAKGWWGHSTSYYRDKENLELEFFANIVSDYAVGNQESLDKYSEYFPTASRLIPEMLDDMYAGRKV